MLCDRSEHRLLSPPRARSLLPDPSPDRESARMVRLREYYRDPNASTAHDVLPAAFAAVRNSADELLPVSRIDAMSGSYPEDGSRSASPPATPSSRSASTPSPRPSATATNPAQTDIETDDADWFSIAEIADVKVHAAMRLRIDNALRRPQQSYFDSAVDPSPRRLPHRAREGCSAGSFLNGLCLTGIRNEQCE